MGGGVMRAVAKVAGIRGVAGEHFPVSSATRRAASVRPAATATEEVKLVASNSEEGSVQWLSSSVDDWVFAGGNEDVVASASDSMPRVVFGGVPSLQEAKEATSELAAALEMTYLPSATSAESEGSVSTDNLHLLNLQMVEAKAFASNDTGIASAVPAPALMAFKFLQESPVAQNIVASVACDPNVWNAVLQNPELQGFLQSQQTCLAGPDDNLTAKLVTDSSILEQSSKLTTDKFSEGESGQPTGGFIDILEKIKGAVVDMMTGLSDFFVNLFGGKGANGASANPDGTGRLTANNLMEASIVGLGVMAILVILLKRA